MSHSARSRLRPSWTLWHRWGYWPLSAVFLPSYLGPLLWHCAPSREKKINHSWIRWQCHSQNHSSEHLWGHRSSIPVCFFAFCYILCRPLCWFIPEARSRCALLLSFMWAVTCICPSRNDLYLSRVRHTWTRGHQSLGRLFRTNQSLQSTCLQPPPQRAALLATWHVWSIYLQSGWSGSKEGHK